MSVFFTIRNTSARRLLYLPTTLIHIHFLNVSRTFLPCDLEIILCFSTPVYVCIQMTQTFIICSFIFLKDGLLDVKR